jgi:hypothetical protein
LSQKKQSHEIDSAPQRKEARHEADAEVPSNVKDSDSADSTAHAKKVTHEVDSETSEAKNSDDSKEKQRDDGDMAAKKTLIDGPTQVADDDDNDDRGVETGDAEPPDFRLKRKVPAGGYQDNAWEKAQQDTDSEDDGESAVKWRHRRFCGRRDEVYPEAPLLSKGLPISAARWTRGWSTIVGLIIALGISFAIGMVALLSRV